MTLQEKIDLMYKQFNSAHSPKQKHILNKGIKRLEGKRRKEKLEKEGVIQ